MLNNAILNNEQLKLKYELKEKLKINKIDLKEFLKYIENEICSNYFYYKLENGYILKLSFEIENIPHLLGIHYYFSTQDSTKGKDLVDGINSGSITIQSLKRNKKEIFKEKKERIEHFTCINYILTTTSCIKFNPIKPKPFSKIKADYLFYSEEIGINLLLGIKKINEKEKIIECAPETFLVDRTEHYSKDQTKLEIKEIIINIKL